MLFTVPGLLESVASRLPDKVAFVEGDQHVTFSQVRDEALRTAHALAGLGAKRGDRIGICMNKTIDQIICILGCLYANCIFVPILPRLKTEGVRHIVTKCDMKLLITDGTRLDEVREMAGDCRLVIGHGDVGTGLPSLPKLRAREAARPFPFLAISTDSAAIIFSSGSTGYPKGIDITHRNLHDGAHIIATYIGTREDDRIAGILTLNFDYGLNQIWQTLLTGCTYVLHDFLIPNELFRFLDRARITALPVMPVIIGQMFHPQLYKADPKLDLSSVRYVCTTGGRVSQDMIDHITGTFPDADFYLMYGLTEAFRSTYLPPDQLTKRPGSIGKAIPDVEILVLDEDNNPVPPGQPGQLVHRGGCLTKGYWNDPEATAHRFRTIPQYPNERLVFSGDIVTKDEDGYLYFVGRNDLMIKLRGFRVSPTEIETIVDKHDAVRASVAFSVENADLEQEIVVAYTTIDGREVAEAELRPFLQTNLPSHMVPRYLCHLERFDATGNEGKIDRNKAITQAKERLGLR